MLKTTFMRSSTLTKESLSKFISDKSIVYLEIAELGAMGNSGGVLLYVFENLEFKKFESNANIDIELFQTMYSTFFNQNSLEEKNTKEFRSSLNYCYGGFGNHVFLSNEIVFKKESNHFSFSMKGQTYFIQPSNLGVLDAVGKQVLKN